MTSTTVGREPVQIVEIQQPICTNEFGVSPCTATGTADTKCYNTRATCQDTANFALDATPLSLYFSKGTEAARGLATYVIPSLVSVSTAPTVINSASSNPDASGLGTRALCTIVFSDHPHTDRVVDPYQSGRTFDPYTRGSFWSKWTARNKYRQNIVIKVYEGYAGQALGSMTVRTYFMQSIDGPDDAGRVKIQGKDILARIEERKAQAPLASPGVLYTDINNTVTSIEVANAVVGDYSTSGTLIINDEIMTYSIRSTSTNGVTFTISARGTDGTTAASHSTDDTVQEVLRFTSTRVDSVINTLLTTYGGIPAGYLDTTGWTSEADAYLNAYNLTTLITEPTSVASLVSDIQEQASCYIWWDERVAKVKLKAIRGIDSEPGAITAENHILAGSFSITENPRQRVSQIWIYYNRDDFTKSVDDPKSYASSLVIANLESETDELYGEASIRKMYAQFLPTDSLALSTGSKIITRYVDTPRECTFQLDAKDGTYWTGDDVKISHFLDVDQFGERKISNWTIISAEEKVHGEVITYRAEDTTLYGAIVVILANGTADWQGDGSDQFNGAWIGDNSGLLSDGTICARIL